VGEHPVRTTKKLSAILHRREKPGINLENAGGTEALRHFPLATVEIKVQSQK
jgi:hypothetical protein